ncbi:hypothetical protein Egran_06735, partial [Elaphomyces granulatus]
NWK